MRSFFYIWLSTNESKTFSSVLEVYIEHISHFFVEIFNVFHFVDFH